jgi:hexokinase
MIKNPKDNPAEQVEVAEWICDRSAKLVAASLAGLVQVLVEQDSSTKKICLAADGSVFWTEDKRNAKGELYSNYKELVSEELKLLLPKEVSVTVINKMEDPNLIGSAIAALS